MQNSLQKLYAAGSEHYDLGDYDAFYNKMANPQSRQKFYQAISRHYDIGDYDTYDAKVVRGFETPAEEGTSPLGQQADISGGFSVPGQPQQGQQPEQEVSPRDMVSQFVEQSISSDPFLAGINRQIDEQLQPEVESIAPQAEPAQPQQPVQQGQPSFEDEGYLETIGTEVLGGLAEAAAGAFTAVGSGMAFLRKRLGSKEGATEVGAKKMQDYFLEKAEEYSTTQEYAGKNLWDNPELIVDPKFLVAGTARMIPSMAAAMLPGTAALKFGRIAAAVVGGASGGLMEGVGTYRETLERGGTTDEAFQNMIEMTIGSGLLNAIGVGKIFGKAQKGKRLIKTAADALVEGITEYLEEPIALAILAQNVGLEPGEVTERLKNGLAVIGPAMIMGGGGSAISQYVQSGQEQVAQQLENEAEQTGDPAIKTQAEQARELAETMKEELPEIDKARQPFTKDLGPEVEADLAAEEQVEAPIDEVDAALNDMFGEEVPPETQGKPAEGITTPETTEGVAEEEVAPEDVVESEKPALPLTAEEIIQRSNEVQVIPDNILERERIAQELADREPIYALEADEIVQINADVERLGSAQEVAERYDTDSYADKYARQRAERLYGAETAPELGTNVPEMGTVASMRTELEQLRSTKTDQLSPQQNQRINYLERELARQRAGQETTQAEAQAVEPPTLTQSGQPYKTEAAANRRAKKMGTGYTVVPTDGGFGIQKQETAQLVEKPAEGVNVPPDVMADLEAIATVASDDRVKKGAESIDGRRMFRIIQEADARILRGEKGAKGRRGGNLPGGEKATRESIEEQYQIWQFQNPELTRADFLKQRLQAIVRHKALRTGPPLTKEQLRDFLKDMKKNYPGDYSLVGTPDEWASLLWATGATTAPANVSPSSTQAADVSIEQPETDTSNLLFATGPKGPTPFKTEAAAQRYAERKGEGYVAVPYKDGYAVQPPQTTAAPKREVTEEERLANEQALDKLERERGGYEVTPKPSTGFTIEGPEGEGAALDEEGRLQFSQTAVRPADDVPGIGVLKVEQALTGVRDRFNIDIRVVGSVEDLTGYQREEMEKVQAEGNIVSAFYDQYANNMAGEIVLLGDAITSEKELFKFIFPHEVAHYGFRQMLGEEGYNEFRDFLARDIEIGPEIQARVDQDKSKKTPLAKKRSAADEWLADKSEGQTIEEVAPNAWRRIVAWFRNWMRNHGFKNLKFSDTEYEVMLKDAFDFARDMSRAGPKFSGDPAIDVMLRKEAAHAEWYSQMQKVITDKLPGMGTVPGFRNMIQAWANKGEIKADELQWSFLFTDPTSPLSKDTGKVAKQEVVDWLETNNVRVEVVERGGNVYLEDVEAWWNDEGGANEEKPWAELTQYEQQEAMYRYRKEVGQYDDEDTKFSGYQLPGGENYREILITLPVKRETLAAGIAKRGSQYYDATGALITDMALLGRIMPPQGEFRASHWSEPNVLVHLRVNDRVDIDGKRVFFLEEVQSDWGQKGREQGFKDEKVLPPGWKIVDNIDGKYIGARWVLLNEKGKWLGSDADKNNLLEKVKTEPRTSSLADKRVPRAPFVERTDRWAMLGMKKALRMAAEGGYDRIAWTTGEQQYDRYGSELIVWERSGDGWTVGAKDQHEGQAGGMNIEEEARARGLLKEVSNVDVSTKEDLARVIRDNISGNQQKLDKLTDRIWDRMQKENAGTSLPRKEAMESYYDQMLPNMVNKYAKKWGGKVGTTDIGTPSDRPWEGFAEAMEAEEAEPSTATVHSLDITPSMRQSVLMGQPLFRMRGRNDLLRELAEVEQWLANPPKVGGKTASDALVKRFEIRRENLMEQIASAPGGLSFRSRKREGESVQGDINLSNRRGDNNLEEMRKKAVEYAKKYVPNSGMSREEAKRYLTAIYGAKDSNALEHAFVKMEAAVIGEEDGLGTDTQGDVKRTRFELPMETKLQHLRRYVQDNMARLQTVQKEIVKQTGEEIMDEMDANMRQVLEVGRAAHRVDKFMDGMVRGKDSFLGRMNADGIHYHDFGLYLTALHTPERRAATIGRKIEKARNERQAEFWKARLADKDDEFGSGMSENQAATIIRDMEEKYQNVKQFADEFYNSVTKSALDMRLEGGLISREFYDKLNETYKNYVPLKGRVDIRSQRPGVGKTGMMATGVKKAKGRESEANDPFVQALVDYTDAISRTEQNRVRQSFLQLVEANPDPAVWRTEPAPEQPNQVDDEGNVTYYEPLKRYDDNVLEVRVDGESHLVVIHDIPLAESMKNLGMERSFSFFNKVNNYLRAVNIMLSPEFLITNFSRDLQTALVHISGEQQLRMAKQTIKYLPSAMKGIWQNVHGKKGVWADRYEQAKEVGGKVSWMHLESVPEMMNTVEKELRHLNEGDASKVLGAIKSVGRVVENANEAVEMGTRLAFYQVMIENGFTAEKAAQAAKELTVNFNTRGQIGPMINSLYLFANAGVQGSFRIFRAIKHPAVRKIVGGIVVLGFLQSLLNRWQDEDEWDQFSDFNKDNYWMWMMPNGKTLAVKVPYGYNVFKVAGNLAEEVAFGNLTLGQAGKRMLSAANDAFNPLGGGSFAQFLSPTAFDPFVQITENKNFYGGPIMKEQADYAPDVPSHRQHFKNVNVWSKALTGWLNKLTGGTEDVSGAVDINPEILDHFTDWMGGGLGRFITNTINLAATAIKEGDLPETEKIPVVRQMLRESSEWVDTGYIYEALNKSGASRMEAKEVEHFNDALERAAAAGEISPSQKKRYAKDFERNQAAVEASLAGFPSRGSILERYENYYELDDKGKAELNRLVAQHNRRATETKEQGISKQAIDYRLDKGYEKKFGRERPNQSQSTAAPKRPQPPRPPRPQRTPLR
jgi:hypothetical protein